MEKRIDKMDKIDKPILDTKSIKIGFNTNKKSSRDLIVIKDFNLYAGEKELIKNANYTLRYGEKVGLIGANGTGKSTLIKCIINEHKKHEGIIKVGNSVNIGYLEQDIIFIDNNKSILEIIKDEYPDNESNVRSYLARFKFYGDDVFKNVEKLSGGEKIRLRLAILMKRENLNLLILDEPTNHIDIKTKEVLEETLINFDGSILFISHDRYILNLLADKIIEIRNKELIEYVGGYEYYKNEIKKASVVNKEIIQLKNKKQSKNNHKINKKKKVNYVKLKLIEDEISIIEKQIEIKKEEINKNPSNYELLTKIIKDIKELEEKLEIKMEEWYDIDK